MTQPKRRRPSQHARRGRERAGRKPAKTTTPDHYLAPSELFVHDPRLSLAVQCGLAVQQHVAAAGEPVALSQICAEMRLKPSTAHRYAATLVALGLLQQDRRRRYYLGHTAGQVGASALGSVLTRADADEILQWLRERTGFTVGLAVLDGPRATYVRRYHAHGRGQYEADAEIRSGAHICLHDSAVGKALLASMPKAGATEVLEAIALSGTQGKQALDVRKLDAEVTESIITGIAASGGKGLQALSIAAFVPRQVEGRSLAVDVTAPAPRIDRNSFEEEVTPHLERAVAHMATALTDRSEAQS